MKQNEQTNQLPALFERQLKVYQFNKTRHHIFAFLNNGGKKIMALLCVAQQQTFQMCKIQEQKSRRNNSLRVGNENYKIFRIDFFFQFQTDFLKQSQFLNLPKEGESSA